MIIDFHTHILPPRVKADRAPSLTADPAFAAIYTDPKAKIADAEDLIAGMDRDGISMSVAVNYSWSTPEFCAGTNDYILESVARYPDRIKGFCAVNLDSPDALAEIDRCARAGASGIGELRPDLLSLDFTDSTAMQPFADVLREHNLILLLHVSEPVGHIYPGKGSATPGMIYPFISAFPDITVVCAHWGGGLPFYALMPEVGEAMQNVYFDTAASPYLYKPEIYEKVAGLIDAEKILFGSDFPLMPPSRLLRDLDSCDLPDDSRGLILSGNARRLLGI